MVNWAPIVWYLKRQTTVKSSTFGSESVAMRVAMDMIKALRYKLCIFGVPIEEATYVLCDNDAVVKNMMAPKSTLKRKHNSIAYHQNREYVASGAAIVGKVGTDDNLADIGTKVLPYPRRKKLLQALTG